MTTDLLEQIEAYIEGNISRAELEAAAAEVEGINLEEEIKWFKNSQLAVEAAGLRNQLTDILPRPEKKEAKIIGFRRRYQILAVAASVLLVVVAYFGFVRNNPGNDLYAQYEFVDPGLPVLMSQSDKYALYDAMTYYSEADYATAEEKLIALLNDQQSNDTILYYLGASQLYQGKIEQAKANLDKVINQKESNYTQKADWLVILATLKEKDQEGVLPLIDLILSNPNHEFYNKAVALKKDLTE